MEVQMLLVVFFVCSVGKAQMSFQRKLTTPSTAKASKASQLKSRLESLQNRLFNRTVDLSEVKQYASAIYKDYTQELQKSIKRFHQVFQPHLETKSERNRMKNIRKCTVRQKERKLGRGISPRRVKIGVCRRSPCSPSDVTCSCQPSKIAFKHIIVKHCQRNRGPKRSGGRRKKSRQGRRCTWRNDVILSAVACECRCQKR